MINGQLDEEDLRNIAKVGITTWCRGQAPPLEVSDITSLLCERAMAGTSRVTPRRHLIGQLRFGCPFDWGRGPGEYNVPRAELEAIDDQLEVFRGVIDGLQEEPAVNISYILKTLKDLIKE